MVSCTVILTVGDLFLLELRAVSGGLYCGGAAAGGGTEFITFVAALLASTWRFGRGVLF